MIRRPPRSTLSSSSAASDVYKRQDVVLPGVSYAESKGTITNSERRIQMSNRAIPALTGYSNWEVVNEMMFILGRTDKYKKVEQLTGEISKFVPEYVDLFKQTEATYWPINGNEILYTDGFHFDDKKARLAVVSESKMFNKRISTDFIEKEFMEFVEKI